MVTIRTSITVYSFLISYIKMRDSLLKLIYIREHFTKREIKTVNEFLVWGLEVNFFSLNTVFCLHFILLKIILHM
jgi:hypothetical protein